MPITVLSNREFNQNPSRAKKAAKAGPVLITDRGQPSLVMLTIEDYQKLIDRSANIVEMLGMPGIEDIDLPPWHADIAQRPVDFS